MQFLGYLLILLAQESAFAKRAYILDNVIDNTVSQTVKSQGRLHQLRSQQRLFGMEYIYDYFTSFYNEMSSYVTEGVIGETLEGMIENFALPEGVKEGDLSELPDYTKSSLCMICDMGMSNLLSAYYYGLPGSFIEQMAISTCKLFRLQTPSVCEGLIHLNMEVILHIADRMGNMTSKQFCGTILESLECYGPDPIVNWEVDLSFVGDKPKMSKMSMLRDNSIVSILNKPYFLSFCVRSVFQDSGGDGGSITQVVQITDLHYDPLFRVGGVAGCDEPLCCRDYQGEAERPEQAAGRWGDYRYCDIPWYVVENAITNIASQHKEAKYIYMTGDIIPHNVWSTTKEDNIKSIQFSGSRFQEILGGKVYPILGNHEPHPANVFAPPYIEKENSTEWLYEAFFEAWGSNLPPDARETFLKGGYYTVSPEPGFRIIALNNMFAYTYNWWMIMDPVDPASELEWFASTLHEAESSNEKVHILAHIPPGTPDQLKIWSREYARIIHRFDHIITGQFNGHTHKEQFNVYMESESGQPSNVAYNAGSVTPYANSNPNYRVYSVESSSWELQDYETFIYNVTEANLTPDSSPRWYRLYSFKEAYGVSSMRPEDIRDLVYRMASNDTLMKEYNRNFIKAGDTGLQKECNEHCTRTRLCEMVTTVSGDFSECEPLLKNFKKPKS
ncbi:sphingomyelin phosphodiesterase-like [Nilaparvata lugens]|uniref:sphingomyelin phosphodiesterase-like n=1 Tax=Nilaparvata lugens TaxID=108931 RepID=UPI00193D49DC|nr:sphingomyelin phosphodiesterase-like [Nilaparvata lugens]